MRVLLVHPTVLLCSELFSGWSRWVWNGWRELYVHQRQGDQYGNAAAG